VFYIRRRLLKKGVRWTCEMPVSRAVSLGVRTNVRPKTICKKSDGGEKRCGGGRREASKTKSPDSWWEACCEKREKQSQRRRKGRGFDKGRKRVERNLAQSVVRCGRGCRRGGATPSKGLQKRACRQIPLSEKNARAPRGGGCKENAKNIPRAIKTRFRVLKGDKGPRKLH